jgi:hypothetical protein
MYLGLGVGAGIVTPPDTTAPLFVSATLAADGLTLTIAYNEALDATSVPTLSLAGTASTVSSVVVTGSTVVGTLNTAAFVGETITVSTSGSPVRDLAHNNATALSSRAVTNNSTVPGAVTELIELSQVAAALGYGDEITNNMVLRTCNPITDLANGIQYVAFHKQLPATSAGQLVLAKRTYSAGAWGSWSVTTTPITPTTAYDGHNYFSMATDGSGRLHLAGDMHGVSMRYWHGATPGDVSITAWVTPPIASGSTLETSVTYPMFRKRNNGDLLFFFRDGGSGNGNLVMYYFTNATATWSIVHSVLVDGETDGQSFYPEVIEYDPISDRVFVAGNWRRTTDVSTNHDLFFFFLLGSENFANAYQVDGTVQTLPVQIANAGYVDSIAENTGLANVGSLTFDPETLAPTCWTFTDPGDGFSQFVAYQWSGSAWVKHWVPDEPQLQNFVPFSYVNLGSGAPDTAFGGPRAERRGDRIILPTRYDAYGSGVWALICESADTLAGWTKKLLDTTDVDAWFGGADRPQWDTNGELYLYHQRCKQPADANIGAQNVSVLHFRPKSATYAPTSVPTLFDPTTYSGAIAYIAPRVRAAKVHGALDSDRFRCIALLDALDESDYFAQATLSDAPLFSVSHFAEGRHGVLFDSTTSDRMLSTDAGILAAIGGVNTPFICSFIWETTTIPTAGMRFWSACSSTTNYLSFGTTATNKFPVFERDVGGTVKQYVGSSGALSNSTRYVITCVFDGTNGYMRVNKVQQGAAVNMAFAGLVRADGDVAGLPEPLDQ